MLTDLTRVVREIPVPDCVDTSTGARPLLSDALLMYRAAAGGSLPADAPVARLFVNSCAHGAAAPETHERGELINFHFTFPPGTPLQNYGREPADWPGYKACGKDDGGDVIQVVSAAVVEDAWADADPGILCKRLVLIGGTNELGGDFQNTPIGQMAGVMILGNAIRGLQGTGGGLHAVPILIQFGVVGIVSALMWAIFHLTSNLRDHYIAIRARDDGKNINARIIGVLLNPFAIRWVLNYATFFVGIFAMVTAIDRGYWGYVSAPAFTAYFAGLLQQLWSIRKSVRKAAHAHSRTS